MVIVKEKLDKWSLYRTSDLMESGDARQNFACSGEKEEKERAECDGQVI